jgi:hypothetical protein
MTKPRSFLLVNMTLSLWRFLVLTAVETVRRAKGHHFGSVAKAERDIRRYRCSLRFALLSRHRVQLPCFTVPVSLPFFIFGLMTSVVCRLKFALFSFTVIFGCLFREPLLFRHCYTEFYAATAAQGENGNFFDHAVDQCGAMRLKCFDALIERYTGNFLPVLPQFRALNPVYFQFCYCLMKVCGFGCGCFEF